MHEQDVRDLVRVSKSLRDIITLVRLFPWVFVHDDQRDVPALVANALRDAESFASLGMGSPRENRLQVLRVITQQFLTMLGQRPNHGSIELIVQEIIGQVDAWAGTQFDDLVDDTDDPF